MTKKTDRRINLTAHEVRGILDGSITQLRRVVRKANWYVGSDDPFGSPGDRLIGRETWADVNTESGPALCYRADQEIITWRDFSEVFGPDEGAGPSMNYEAYPGDYVMWWLDLLEGAPDHHWKRSTHMPRWASRITLLVKTVRMQRLGDVTEADAKAEGVEQNCIAESPADCPACRSCNVCEAEGEYERYGDPESLEPCFSAVESRQTLWNANAKPGEEWNPNLWTFVAEVEKKVKRSLKDGST